MYLSPCQFHRYYYNPFLTHCSALNVVFTGINDTFARVNILIASSAQKWLAYDKLVRFL